MQSHYLSNEELEHYWFSYKTESEIHGTSLEKFCRDNKISYKAMDNWRRQSKHRIYPVEIIGRPTVQLETKEAANEVTPTEGNEAETPAPIATERRYDRFTSCKHRSG